jgi:mono/diheme cytochrome c family protein
MPNPGFNEVVDGKPVGWTEVRVYGDGTPFESKSTPDGRNGTPGLMLSSDKTTDGGAIINLRVKPGTRYRLTAWAKAINLQPAGEGLGTMLFVEGGDRSNSVKGNSDWTQLTTELETGDRSRLLIHCLIGAFGGATGSVIHDDISLTEIPGASGAKGFLGELAAKTGNPAAPVVAERKFKVDAEVHQRGAAIYALTCVACHQPTGAGLENAFPPLDGSDWLTGDPTLPIRIVIGGLQGPVKVSGKDYNAVMPPHVDLDDAKISDVLTYVRQSWSNDAAPVTPDQVKEVRAKHKDRTAPWTAAELGR